MKDDNRDYKPDDKSRTRVGAGHAPGDGRHLVPADSIIDGKFDWDPEAAKQAEAQFTSGERHRRVLQEDVPGEAGSAARAAGRPDWRRRRLLRHDADAGGEFIGLANNHSIHHRGQLAAYLRAMGSKVPAIYGGSADEPMQDGVACRPDVVSRSPHVPRSAPPRRRPRHGGRAGRSAARGRGDPPPRDRGRRAGAALHQRHGLATSASSPTCSAPRAGPSSRSASGRCA